MAAGENSVQRANRMIRERDAEIRDRKMDALYNKQALMLFIKNGGGLDMYV